LQIHELAVLAGDELDGQYYFSKELLKILISGSDYFSMRLRAENVIVNDKYTTMTKPFFTDEKGEVYFYLAQDTEFFRGGNLFPERYNKDGGRLICSSIGKKYVSHSVEYIRRGRVSFADYNDKSIIGLYNDAIASSENPRVVISSVTCE
jgi:hypothetical protein